jgi:hypothetical protein
MFLLGDTFLRNFYSVYDYDGQSVHLAVNVHSQDLVKISMRKDQKWPYLIVYGLTVAVSAIAYLLMTWRLTKATARKLAVEHLTK